MKLKKTLAILSAITMTAMYVPVSPVAENIRMSASAEETTNIIASGIGGENIVWSVNSDGLLNISGSGECTGFYNEKGEKSLAMYSYNVRKIVISDGITSIPKSAFMGCYYLEEVTLGKDIETISARAFDGCHNLTTLNIPADSKLKTISEEAFLQCNELDFKLPESLTYIGDYAFFNTAISASELPARLTFFGRNAFSGSEISIKTVPKGITEISSYAFEKCENITEFTVPATVTTIGSGAFTSCTGLKTFKVPDTVKKLESSVFSCCTSLESVTIPESYTEIPDSLFSWCTNLVNFNFPKGVTSIGDGAFTKCEKFTEFSLPETVTTIGTNAFSGCTGLTSFKVPEKVKVIEEGTFDGCSNLTSVELPAKLEGIVELAFANCPKLKSFTIPDTVNMIGGLAIGYFYEIKQREDLTEEEIAKIMKEAAASTDSLSILEQFSYTITSPMPDITIYGYDNSSAYMYARKYNIKFVSLGESKEWYNEDGLCYKGKSEYGKTSDNGFVTNDGKKFTASEIENAPVKPIITIGDITIKESELPADRIIPVTISVSGADKEWADATLAVFFDERLGISTKDENYRFGNAINENNRAIWSLNPVLSSYFPTYHDLPSTFQRPTVSLYVSGSNLNNDGDIVTIDFKVPENISEDTEYPIVLKYTKDNRFDKPSYKKEPMLMTAYAYTHVNNGVIKVIDDVKETTPPVTTPSATTTTTTTTTTTITKRTLSTTTTTSNTTTKPTTTAKITTKKPVTTTKITTKLTNPQVTLTTTKITFIKPVTTGKATTTKKTTTTNPVTTTPVATTTKNVIYNGEIGFDVYPDHAELTLFQPVKTTRDDKNDLFYKANGDVVCIIPAEVEDVPVTNIIDWVGIKNYCKTKKINKMIFENPEFEFPDFNIFDRYGIDLTICGYEGSTAQKYAKANGFSFETVGGTNSKAGPVGDIDGNNTIDASDASAVLVSYAIAQTGGEAMDSYTADQLKAADVDGNGTADASDASSILAFYAYKQTGGDKSFAEFLKG